MYALRLLMVLGLLVAPAPRKGLTVRVVRLDVQEEVAPMADKTRWVSTSGFFEDVSSWDNGLPVDNGDMAVFDGTSQVSLRANSAVDSTLTRGVGEDFHLLITPEYAGNIGQSGNPLTWPATSTEKIICRGTGTAYLGPDGGNVVIDSTNRVNACYLSGVPDQVFVKQGRLFVTSTCGVTNGIWVDGQNARVDMAAKNAAELSPRILSVRNGLLVNHRAGANPGIIFIGAGRLDQYGTLPNATDVYVGPLGELALLFASGETSGCRMTVDGVLDVSLADSGVIDLASIVIGPHGHVVGNIAPSGGTYPYIDLRLDEP